MRYILSVLVFVLSCNLVFAQESIILKVDNYKGVIGDEVTAYVTISENSNICVGSSLNIVYDNLKLELVLCEAGGVIKNAMPSINYNYKPDVIKISFMTIQPIKNGGVLCKLVFKIKSAEGVADISIANVDFRDFDEKSLPISIQNGKIEIINNTVSENVSSSNNSHNNTSIPTEKNIKFTDISNYSWAEKEINYLADKGIIKGSSSTTFEPQNNIKRADYIVLLVRMLGLKADVNENFTDVENDKYYYKEIGIAKTNGLISGIGSNKFEPESFISRQDMFAIAYRILNLKLQLVTNSDTKVLNSFVDEKDISDYASTAIATLITNGLVKGDGDTLNPNGNATRAETAVFIYRFNEFMTRGK